jgi:hypothetical protein
VSDAGGGGGGGGQDRISAGVHLLTNSWSDKPGLGVEYNPSGGPVIAGAVSATAPTTSPGQVSDDLSCSGASGASCELTGQLTPATGATAARVARHREVLGSSKLTLLAGHRKRMIVKLNRIGKALARRGHALRVAFILSEVTHSGGTRTVERRILPLRSR